jgi:hypothetical protein
MGDRGNHSHFSQSSIRLMDHSWSSQWHGSSLVVPCDEPTCPAVAEDQITDECTDRCVVISCTDPAHESLSCHDGEGTACEMEAECTDCSGLEDLVGDGSLFVRRMFDGTLSVSWTVVETFVRTSLIRVCMRTNKHPPT